MRSFTNMHQGDVPCKGEKKHRVVSFFCEMCDDCVVAIAFQRLALPRSHAEKTQRVSEVVAMLSSYVRLCYY